MRSVARSINLSRSISNFFLARRAVIEIHSFNDNCARALIYITVLRVLTEFFLNIICCLEKDTEIMELF